MDSHIPGAAPGGGPRQKVDEDDVQVISGDRDPGRQQVRSTRRKMGKYSPSSLPPQERKVVQVPQVKKEIGKEKAIVKMEVESEEDQRADDELSSTDKALKRIHDKLRDPGELLKLHLKHYHMNLENFKRRTSCLKIPPDIYKAYDKICLLYTSPSPRD